MPVVETPIRSKRSCESRATSASSGAPSQQVRSNTPAAWPPTVPPPWSGLASVAAMKNASAAAKFRAGVEDAIERDAPAELGDLALEVGLAGEPWEWAQSCCIQLARHRSAGVRASAVASFGHLARRFGRLDPGRVRSLVEIALHDPSAAVRARADDAADDLLTFLGWELDRPARGDE